MANIIFYFSGTGNSFAVGQYLVDKLRETKLVPITQISMYNISTYDRIGFIFPVYYIHAPEIVLRLIKNIKIRSTQQVFTIAVYAASWGYASSEIREELTRNKVIHMQEFRVKMPGNHILEYGAFPMRYQYSLIDKAMKQLDTIAAAIKQNVVTKPITPNLLARLFKHNGEKIKSFGESGSRFYTNEEKCQQCGLCLQVCPVENIVNIDGNVIWGDQCQRCMACIQWCPFHAVNHPELNEKRRRYTFPGMTCQQFLQGKQEGWEYPQNQTEQ